mmetsp:Transcript_7335/g.16870  ORF Transcript_7335/g.16870 Transcript_7335/m.16870 type:complete len:208 (+) Transcript_7335:262-885(+)
MTPPELQSPKDDEDPGANATTWVEVEGESLEDLQRELEVVTCRPKPCMSMETQTEGDAEEVPEDCADRWFSGFIENAPPARNTPQPASKVTTDLEEAKESSSSDSSSDSSDDEAACKPERQLRRSTVSPGREGADGPPAPTAETTADAKSSSSSSSSSGSPRRQRAPSSDEEAAPAESTSAVTADAGSEMPVDPRRLRVMQDYSDVY